MSELRALAAGHNLHRHKERGRLIAHLAQAMHEAVCGSWLAAGYDTKLRFVQAAEKAADYLDSIGLDLFAYPDGGWNEMPPPVQPSSEAGGQPKIRRGQSA